MKDEDLMPFGSHRGTAMANVPAEYLIWLYDEITSSHVIEGDRKKVLGYIEEHLEDLQDEVIHAKEENDESDF